MKLRTVLTAIAVALILAGCSVGGSTGDPAGSGGTGASQAALPSGPNGAPAKAMEITEPDADRDAVCNLFTPGEIFPLTGGLRVLEGGYKNPSNDHYIGGRINSCLWYGEKADLELVITSDGNNGAVYRTNVDAATNASDPMCGDHSGGNSGATVCVFGDIMYLVNTPPPLPIDEDAYDPPSDEELAAFMQEALTRTGGVGPVTEANPVPSTEQSGPANTVPSNEVTQPAAQNCSLISAEEATRELGSPVTLTTETGPCMFATAQGFTLMMNTEAGEQDPNAATYGQALPEPYPGCTYNKMGEDTLLAQCMVQDHGFIFTGMGLHGQSIGQPQIDAVSQLINLAMTRV